MKLLQQLARPDILALEPYRHAQWQPGLERLHANESPWRDTADSSVAGWHRYPEPQPAALRQALAEMYGLRPEQLLLSRGSDEGIDLLTRAFCRAGQDRILICPPTFGMYQVAAAIQGAAVTQVPLRSEGFALDVEGVLAACCEHTRLVFLCSPNNPTGNLLEADAILRLLERLGERALVVLDEAYIEYAQCASLSQRLQEFPQLVILRTLSKAHGLAGLRCGAVLAHPAITELLGRMIPPYALATPSIELALAALAPERRARTAAQVAELVGERERLAARLAGLAQVRKVHPSAANFLCVEFRDPTQVLQRTREAGLMLRALPPAFGLEGALRVTVARPETNDRLMQCLEDCERSPDSFY